MNQKFLKLNNLFLNKDSFKSNYFILKTNLLNYSTNTTHDENKISLDFDNESIKTTNLNNSSNLKDNSFKLNELILCRILNRKKPNDSRYSTRLFTLEKNAIFKTKSIEVFHEHIIHKSMKLNQQNVKQSKNDLSVSFHLASTSIYFKRPTLYEYISLKAQQAVSSHFSIISLAPMLLELNKTSRVLECGTGSGSMSLFLSQYLGDNGVLHTFDLTNDKEMKAKKQFLDWKNSYDLYSNEKWPSNVKFGVANLCTQEFNESFLDYYDAVYLDMPDLDKAVYNIHKLIKQFGVVVCNAMHLTQILKMLNAIKKHNLGFETELIMEPNNRLWEIDQIKTRERKDENGNNEISIFSDDVNTAFSWTCRLEDRFLEKTKRGGLWFNYWPGYLCKLRKVR